MAIKNYAKRHSILGIIFQKKTIGTLKLSNTKKKKQSILRLLIAAWSSHQPSNHDSKTENNCLAYRGNRNLHKKKTKNGR